MGANPIILDAVITDAERIQRGLSALLLADPSLHSEMIAMQDVINALYRLLESLPNSHGITLYQIIFRPLEGDLELPSLVICFSFLSNVVSVPPTLLHYYKFL